MILGRAYLKEIALHLGMVLGGITLLLAIGAAVRASAESQGAPLWLTAALMPLIVGSALPYLGSVTLLVAVILTYGRMAADRELLALRTAGVRPVRLLLPALLAGGAVAGLSYPLSARVLPEVYERMRNLTFQVRFAALENVRPSSSELHVQGIHLLWRGRDPDGAFRDVTFFWRDSVDPWFYYGDPGTGQDLDEKGLPLPNQAGEYQLRADRALLVVKRPFVDLAFEGVRTFGEAADEAPWGFRNPGGTLTVRINLTEMERPDWDKKPEEYRSSELLQALSTSELPPARERRFQFTFWRRVVMAVAALPLALLGALLGWRLRRGGFLAALATAFGTLFLFFYPFYYLGDALQQAEVLHPALAAWMPVAGLVPVLAGLWTWSRR